MAQVISKRKLTNEEIDALVTPQIVGVLDKVSKVFDVDNIKTILLCNNEIEIDADEVLSSIKRLLNSGVLEIKMSNFALTDADGIGYKLRVVCDVVLAQKRSGNSTVPPPRGSIS